MTKKLSISVIVALSLWTAIRFIVAERVAEPAYILAAGTDYIRQEWNYCSRFDNRPNPGNMLDRSMNYLNDTFFRISQPLFRLENRVLGRRIEKGDPDYEQFMGRVQQIGIYGWDYAVSSHRDGRGLMVVKNRSIAQTIE